MKYGLYLPNFGQEINARTLAELANQAEESGWDGFFLWDHILYSKSQRLPMVDPWVALAAIAMRTERIRLGTTVTPIARRRPWKLARETASLDVLSGGRLILSVGLGEPTEAEFEMFGEEGDAKVRAARLDEGLDVLTGLWRGKPFSYNGEHYKLKKMTFLPTPVQAPRIPIWVGGFWPNKPPFRRAALWDGVVPLKKGGRLTPNDLRSLLDYIQEYRTSTPPFDAAVIGWGVETGRWEKQRALLEQAGMTWWLESLYRWRDSLEELKARIRCGPPR